MFIVGVIQHVKIGDLSGFAPSNAPGTEMDIDADRNEELRKDERALARESTSGFAGSYHSNMRLCNPQVYELI
jgi:hypothetical protein